MPFAWIWEKSGPILPLVKVIEEAEKTLKFDRIFLSNIPDYTSMFYAMALAMPLLKAKSYAFMRASTLLNCGLWRDYNDYIYSGSLLRGVENARKLLNFTLSSGELMEQ